MYNFIDTIYTGIAFYDSCHFAAPNSLIPDCLRLEVNFLHSDSSFLTVSKYLGELILLVFPHEFS